MKIKDAEIGNDVQNSALELFWKFMESFKVVDDALSRFKRDSLYKELTGLKLSNVAKVIIANNFLLPLLMSPPAYRLPTYHEIAEASGVKVHNVQRILRGDYDSSRPLHFTHDIQLLDHTKLGFKRKRARKVKKSTGRISSATQRLFLTKKRGKKSRDMNYISTAGRPSKFVWMMFKNPISAIYQRLGNKDKEKLIAYLQSQPFIDTVKQFLQNIALCLSAIKELPQEVFDIGERSIEIAEKNGVKVPEDMKRFFTDKHHFDDIMKSLEFVLNGIHNIDISEQEVQRLITKIIEDFNLSGSRAQSYPYTPT